MTGVIPPLPLPPLPTAVTVPTPITTLSLPLPTLPVPTIPLPTIPTPTLPNPTTPGTVPATTAPTVTGVPPTAPGPSIAPPTTPPATPTSAAPSQPGTSTTTSPGQQPGGVPPSTECVRPTSTSTSTSTPDSSVPDSSEPETSEPPVQLPVPTCEPGAAPTTTPSPSASAPAGMSVADLATAAAIASLEVLEINAYGAVQQAAAAGSLGETVPAVDTYLATALDHHRAALQAWNDVLVANGQPAATTSPLDLTVSANEQFAVVRDITGAAGVLRSLETTAAATYLFAVRTLQSPAVIGLAASILPVDRQHVSALLFLTGGNPAPDAFASEDFAYVP
jgi:hypothetical protein